MDSELSQDLDISIDIDSEDYEDTSMDIETEDDTVISPIEQSSEAKSDQPARQITIAAEGLRRHFKHQGELVKAVDGVSFAFTEGQFVTIMGPSGSGKSTLLYMLGGLDKATDGKLIVDGVDVRHLSGRQEHLFRRQKLGFVFQSFHLISSLTALENVMLPMELMHGKSRAEMRERARRLLLDVGINEDRHSHRPGRLSGGQQQRVAIARALANDPKVILADEPTGNLDSRNGKIIIQLLERLSKQGKTVVIVTHDRSIAKVADVRVELEDGKIVTMDNHMTPDTNKVLSTQKRSRRK
jgi:ABC-type lipoprotein export system ATPase subunit